MVSATAETVRSRRIIVPAYSIEEAAQNLLRDGWTRLSYGTLSRQFNPVIKTLRAITEDPERHLYEIRDARELDADGEQDLGLIIKPKGGTKTRPRKDEIAEGRLTYDDTKFTYQHKQRILGYYARHPGLIEKHPEFFLHTARMHDEASLLALEIAEEMDKQMPGYAFAQRMQKTWSKNLLRLLRYLCDGDVPNIAQRHRDKSFLTIHIGSDRGGLWLADNKDAILADAGETQTDSVLIFLSRKAWEITRGNLKGIVHGVRDTTFTNLLGRMPRHTAVGFFHAEVEDDERAWADEHMHELTIPDHVKKFEMS